MDLSEMRDGEFVVDIESGRIMSEEASTPDSFTIMVSGGSMGFDSSVNGENGMDLIKDIENGVEVSTENVKVLMNKEVEGVKASSDLAVNKMRKERRKSTSAKKPPRPPRGLSLDAADQKLIKEIAALAMIKRARIERMKALKRMKAAKASSTSSSSGIFFALFTFVFCLLIVVQGMSCQNCSASKFHGSPETIGSTESLIMAQYQKSLSTNGVRYSGSESPSLVEQVSGSERENMAKRAAG